MKKAISLISALVMLVSLCSCNMSHVKEQTETVTAMNTVMSLTIYSNKKTDEVFEELEKEIEILDMLLTVNPVSNKGENGVDPSDVVRINTSGEPVEVSDFTVEIINKALEANKITDGAFDITINPVIEMWGFNDATYGVPGKAERENALKLVGSDKLTVEGNTVGVSELSSINLGGIAKGALGDDLKRILDKHGMSAVLSLGGNIVLVGNNPAAEKWSVGVKAPNEEKALICKFRCAGDRSVVTSGGYERYFEYKGKRYHHIIDPATGAPAESDLQSVTVIGKDGAMCDAFSTALFVMGSEKAVEFAKEHNDYEYIFVTEDKILASASISDLTAEINTYTVETF